MGPYRKHVVRVVCLQQHSPQHLMHRQQVVDVRARVLRVGTGAQYCISYVSGFP